jgi:acyl-CoA synthetase (NDP forming)
MTTTTIDSILNPQSVAIVGASDDLAKWGGSILGLLQKFKFPGKVYPVNPKSALVQALPAYSSVVAIGRPVDVAVLAVPNTRAVEAFQDCAAAGVKAILMVTAQFAESGEEGQKLQDELIAIARKAGIRVIGPNCMGYFNAHADLCLLNAQAFMRNPYLHKGSIAMISQSGALAGTMLARAYDIGTGFSFCVSLGNQADLEVCDFLEYALTDSKTKVIALYVEGLKTPQRFLSLLRQARAVGKPVLLTKAGRTDSGQRAVQSHTASMAGEYQAFEAAVRYEGAVIVDDPLELVMQAASWSLPVPKNPAIAVFSGSGGGGAVASDLIDEAGLEAAVLSAETVQKLLAYMPESSAHLPFDLGSVPMSYRSGQGEWLKDIILTVMADPGIGAGIFMMTTQPDMVGTAETIIAVNRSCEKPVLFVNAASSCGGEAAARLRAADVVNFGSIKDAVRYFKHRLAFEQHMAMDLAAQAPALGAPVQTVVQGLKEGLVSEFQSKQLLAAAGIPTTAGEVVTSPQQAVQVAEKMGYPVVMKVMSPQVSHKSDIGGVVLNVQDAAAVQRQFKALESTLDKVPGAVFEGCLVQQMAKADAELLVGTHWDAQFGSMLMFGFGGTLVELQRDTALLPAAASRAAIAQALAGLRLYPLLTGYRGREAANLDAIVDLIYRMGQLAVQLGEHLSECEANPVMVRGKQILVADARAVWKETV